MIPLAAVREAIRKDISDQLLACVRATRREGTRNCPCCAHPMTVIEVPRGPNPVTLDVCYNCECVWFDGKKSEALKVMYGMPEPPKHLVDHKWKWAVAILGMPVEQETTAMLNRAWLTWILAGLIASVSLAAWFFPWLELQFSLVPAHVWRWGGITLLTAFLALGTQ